MFNFFVGSANYKSVMSTTLRAVVHQIWLRRFTYSNLLHYRQFYLTPLSN